MNNIIDRAYLVEQFKNYNKFAFYVQDSRNYYDNASMGDTGALKVVSVVSDPLTEIELDLVSIQISPVDLSGLVGDGSEYVVLKSETIDVPKYYTAEEVDELISQLNTFEIEVVDVLPAIETDPIALKKQKHTIYLTPEYDVEGSATGNNTEWLLVNRDGLDAFEVIGTTSVDLRGYVKKEDIMEKTIAGYEESSVGVAGAKIIVADGTVSDAETEIELSAVTPVLTIDWIPSIGEYTLYVPSELTDEYIFIKKSDIIANDGSEDIDFETEI